MLNSIRHGLLLLPTARRIHGVPFLFLLPPTNPCPARSFSSSSVAPHSHSRSQTLNFLIDSCGLSPESAIVASRKLRFKSSENAIAVIRLLRGYGLGETDVSAIISMQPNLLSFDSRRILRPKIEALRGFGFSGESLARVLTAQPVLLTRSLQKHIVPCFTFLRTLLAADGGDLVSVFTRNPQCLNASLNNAILPILGVLREHNLPEARISKLVKIHPRVLILSLRRMNEIVDQLKAAGVLPSDLAFIYAFRAVAGQKSASWDRKIAVFKASGLSAADVASSFRRHPWVMLTSEEKIRRSLELFLRRLKLSPGDIVRHPILLKFSLEKRILPRCAVVSLLKRKGKLEEGASVVPALLVTTSSFLKSFVARYQDDVPEVLEAYNGEIKFNG